MSLKDKIQDNIVLLIASVFATGVSTGWLVAEKVRVYPIEKEKQHLVARLDRIETYDIPNLLAKNPSILEPRKQYEIVKLYERLSMAIEKADLDEITSFYAKNYRQSEHDRNIVFQGYKNLLGKKVFFHISLIRYCDDGRVAAHVKAFFPPGGNYIDSKDILVFIDNDWKFVQ